MIVKSTHKPWTLFILSVLIASVYGSEDEYDSGIPHVKKPRHEDIVAPIATSSSTHVQVYGIPTYDSLFKYVLDDPTIQPSFFNAFIPGITVTESQRLDEHMNPLQKYQELRALVSDTGTKTTVNTLKKAHDMSVSIKKDTSTALLPHEKGTLFLKDILTHFDDLSNAFPKEHYDGTMDFVCKLNTGEYALVELQVVRQDYWDKRALAYVAAFYGNQLRTGGEWRDIRKVIGINILGGGRDENTHWKDTPDQYMRHYMFQEQINGEERYIHELQLFQYSIANAPKGEVTQAQKDWLIFLRNGYKMSEEEVARIPTESVRKAFDRAKLSKMTPTQLEAYEEEDVRYRRISGLIEEKRQEGLAKGKAEGELTAKRSIALEMLKENEPEEKIIKYSKLTSEELSELKASL
jgi:predicted transposase/invertase (TIGR01784 family)